MHKLVLTISILASTLSANASEPLGEPYLNCAACHGSTAQGNNAMQAPFLKGQNKNYLNRQIVSMLNGERQLSAAAQAMLPALRQLSQPQREALVQQLAAIDIAGNVAIGASSETGYKAYQAKCGSCHGSVGQGNEKLYAPKLVGLTESYMMTQMIAFDNGQRGTETTHKYGRQMAMMARIADDPEMRKEILAYIASL